MLPEFQPSRRVEGKWHLSPLPHPCYTHGPPPRRVTTMVTLPLPPRSGQHANDPAGGRDAASQAVVLVQEILGPAVRHGAGPADDARRDGRARLGQLRHHPRHRRRLHRPPELRHGDHRPPARGAGLPRRHHRAARLAERRRVQGARPAEPVLRRHRRQHGFDGQPLHVRPPHPPQRQLHAGRRRRQAPRPLGARLRAALPRSLPRDADRARRHRKLAAPHRALRLLVRQGAPLGARRRQGRHPALRQRRARRRRGRPPYRSAARHRPPSTTSAAPPS